MDPRKYFNRPYRQGGVGKNLILYLLDTGYRQYNGGSPEYQEKAEEKKTLAAPVRERPGLAKASLPRAALG